MRYIFCLLCLLLAAPVWAQAPSEAASAGDGYIQVTGSGTINWGNGLVRVVRLADPPAADSLNPARAEALAVRQAAMSARKDVLQMIEALPLQAGRTVGWYLGRDNERAEEARRLLQNSRLTRSRVEEGERIAVSIDLRGELGNAVIPESVPFLSGTPPRLSNASDLDPAEALQKDAARFVPEAPVELEPAAVQEHSGIIIDARGMNPKPGVLVRVYGQDGMGVYGTFNVSRAGAVEYGMAAYVTDMTGSTAMDRAGTRPLVVRAVGLTLDRVGLILSAADAARVRAALADRSLAEQCRVVVVRNSDVSAVSTATQ